MDEGYLDVGEVARDFLAARVVAEAVQTAVRAATSLTCSLGVAPCKVVAKVASDARKPGGLVVVPSGREAAFLAPLAVRRLPGVGPKAEERLRAAGIETIGDLAALTDEDLRRLLPGSVGTMLRDRARGIDPRELELDTERISISVENTFERDISDRERLHDELRGMAAEVATALQRHGQVARTVTTKLRYADFSIRSRSMFLERRYRCGGDDRRLCACQQLDRGLSDRPGALRLVGVGVSGLADFRQLVARSGLSSRGGGTRTPDLRFWRPPLYQLSYAPVSVGQCTERVSAAPRPSTAVRSARAAARARGALRRPRGRVGGCRGVRVRGRRRRPPARRRPGRRSPSRRGSPRSRRALSARRRR